MRSRYARFVGKIVAALDVDVDEVLLPPQKRTPRVVEKMLLKSRDNNPNRICDLVRSMIVVSSTRHVAALLRAFAAATDDIVLTRKKVCIACVCRMRSNPR